MVTVVTVILIVYCSSSAWHVPATALSALYLFSHLILITLQSSQYATPILQMTKLGVRKIASLSEVTQLSDGSV